MEKFYEEVIAYFIAVDRAGRLQRAAGLYSLSTNPRIRSPAVDRDSLFPAVPAAQHTPDLFVINTAGPTTTPFTGTPLVTDTAVPTFTATFRPTITLEPLDPTLFTPSPNIFLNVQRNTSQLVWGGTCAGDRAIRFIAQVQPVRRLRYVTLWYRLQDKYSGRNTGWGGGAIMSDNDQGTYFYDLQLNQIHRYRYYQDAWLQYQLVASTATQRVLGRSVVSRTDVSLTNCKVLNP